MLHVRVVKWINTALLRVSCPAGVAWTIIRWRLFLLRRKQRDQLLPGATGCFFMEQLHDVELNVGWKELPKLPPHDGRAVIKQTWL